MPPYPLFLYAVKIFFTNTEIFLWVIQFIQILFALISIYFTHKILLEFFSEKLSLIGTLIFTIFPLNIYAVSQISSISMQILLINVFLFSLLRLFRKLDLNIFSCFQFPLAFDAIKRRIFYICNSLNHLPLSETKKLIKMIIIVLITILVVSPYLYRNYGVWSNNYYKIWRL